MRREQLEAMKKRAAEAESMLASIGEYQKALQSVSKNYDAITSLSVDLTVPSVSITYPGPVGADGKPGAAITEVLLSGDDIARGLGKVLIGDLGRRLSSGITIAEKALHDLSLIN